MKALITFLAALVLAPAAATAQTALVLPAVSGDSQVSEEARAAVLGVVTTALGAEGFQVRDIELTAEQATCTADSCAAELLESTQTDVAVTVTLWSSPRAPTEVGEVIVSIINPDGIRFNGTGDVTGADIAPAVGEAVHEAKARLTIGPGPFLVVDAIFGATVYIDGELAGGAPYRARVEPGQYEVRVERAGYLAQTRTVDVPDDVTATETVEIQLVSTDVESPAEPVAGYILAIAGGAAFVAGLSVLIAGAVQASEDGHRADEGLFGLWGAVAGGGLALGIVGLALSLDGSSTVAAEARLGPTTFDFGRL